jgi:hypothetical protein
MKLGIFGAILLSLSLIPSVSYAKGVPLFFQTGDELFAIDGAPEYDDGYSVGYACKRFGLFGADVWTWDCKLMAINLDKFSVGDLDSKELAQVSAKYSEDDRRRNIWNHYGVLVLLIGLIGVGIAKMRAS